jgi:hypothetical protein
MSTSTVTIIALICIAVGYLVGYLVGSMTAKGKPSGTRPVVKTPITVVEKPKEQPVPEEVPETAQPTAAPSRPAAVEKKPELSGKNATAKPASIVQQIDDILQSQISNTDLHNKGIRLAETPGEGVTVWIGLKPYQGVDAVDDPEVKEAIQNAVKTWEGQAR